MVWRGAGACDIGAVRGVFLGSLKSKKGEKWEKFGFVSKWECGAESKPRHGVVAFLARGLCKERISLGSVGKNAFWMDDLWV